MGTSMHANVGIFRHEQHPLLSRAVDVEESRERDINGHGNGFSSSNCIPSPQSSPLIIDEEGSDCKGAVSTSSSVRRGLCRSSSGSILLSDDVLHYSVSFASYHNNLRPLAEADDESSAALGGYVLSEGICSKLLRATTKRHRGRVVSLYVSTLWSWSCFYQT